VVLIFKIVASVLKLGNIGFTPTSNIDGTEGCTVSNDYGTFFLSRAPQMGMGNLIDFIIFNII
jgi:hypothetical protein